MKSPVNNDFKANADKAASEMKDKERTMQIEKGLSVDEKKIKGLGRADIEEQDMQESFFKYFFIFSSNFLNYLRLCCSEKYYIKIYKFSEIFLIYK